MTPASTADTPATLDDVLACLRDLRDLLRHDPGRVLVADARLLAELLGVSVRHVRTLDSAGKIPRPVRIGERVTWRLDEVRDWLAAGCPDRRTWDTLRRVKGGNH